MIIINALSIRLNGRVTADGARATLPDPANEGVDAGAGSGGSIQVFFETMFGGGAVTANGGDAFVYGGEGRDHQLSSSV